MRVSRLYVDLSLAPSGGCTLPPEASHYLAKVLRLRPGDGLILFNGRDGRDYSARYLGGGARAAEVELLGAGPVEPEPPLAITLVQGISRGERMDLVLQKATELGVSAIQPLFSERSQVQLSGERLLARVQHWRGVVRSAAEQCGRRRLPVLAEPQPLEAWLASPRPQAILLDPAAGQSLSAMAAPDRDLQILVGPEGGLSPAERQQAAAAGCRAVRLGPRILRTETAPLAALAIAQALWGDLR